MDSEQREEQRETVGVQQLSSDDYAVQGTNDDATVCKRHAVRKGYWKDSFITYMGRLSEHRSPEISRGYYARVTSIRSLMKKFISMTHHHCQVVNLGAGFDTTYWQLQEDGCAPHVFFEVDFPAVTARKAHYIKTKPPLFETLQKCGEVKMIGEEVSSSSYYLVSGDMRNMDTLGKKLTSKGLDFGLPTMFVAECVLVYMEPHLSQSIIRWAGTNFNTALFLNYEPIHPHDRFGETMQRNLTARGCSLLGIDACPDLDSQRDRFLQNGWSSSWALDMLQVYQQLPQDDVQRIERLDFLDEKELLTQLLQHYTLSCGYNDSNSIGLDKVKL